MSSCGDQSRTAFRDFAADPSHQGRWWPDETIVEVFQCRYGIADLNIKNFNTFMSKDPTYGPNMDRKEANETGVFRNPRMVKTDSDQTLSLKFYFILSEADSKRAKVEGRDPKCPEETRYWQQYYDNNRIKISRRKRDREDDAKVPAKGNVNSADKADFLESTKQLQQKLQEEFGDYWDSKDARNVFNTKEGKSCRCCT